MTINSTKSILYFVCAMICSRLSECTVFEIPRCRTGSTLFSSFLSDLSLNHLLFSPDPDAFRVFGGWDGGGGVFIVCYFLLFSPCKAMIVEMFLPLKTRKSNVLW